MLLEHLHWGTLESFLKIETTIKCKIGLTTHRADIQVNRTTCHRLRGEGLDNPDKLAVRNLEYHRIM